METALFLLLKDQRLHVVHYFIFKTVVNTIANSCVINCFEMFLFQLCLKKIETTSLKICNILQMVCLNKVGSYKVEYA